MAKDIIIERGAHEVIGGYLSPVSDMYKKPDLAPAVHRIQMCALAVDNSSDWLMVDPWEVYQMGYTRTAFVLEHFDLELNGGRSGGILTRDGGRKKIKVMLLVGGDLVQSFCAPGVWPLQSLRIVLRDFGCVVIERTGSDARELLLSHTILHEHRDNIIIVKQLIYNDISSSKVRLFIKRGLSIKFLLPGAVIGYMDKHMLYRSESPGSSGQCSREYV
ncbi:cytidylyltransferase domain-containing protein [Ceratobasidium sp. AG-Ba]|nr:cytidylyltransferase domain-containing protein [Ceratobasidium sp. AG-Ba]